MPGATARAMNSKAANTRTMIGAMVSAVILLWVLSSNHPFGLAHALPIGLRGLVELAIILSACAAFVYFNNQKPLFRPLAAFGTNHSSVKHLWRKRDYVHFFGTLFIVSLAVSVWLVFNKSFIEHKFGMGFKEMVFKHIPHMKYGVAYRNWLAQSNFLYWIIYNFGGEMSQQGHADAQRYYESQRPYLQKAYAEFQLHKHYAAMRTAVQSYGPYAKWDFHALIALRASMYHEQYLSHGWEDWRIEKDKCDMYRFFQNNDLPHPPVIKFWDSLSEVQHEIRQLMLSQDNSGFPMYTKFCHLTTGNALSVVPTKKKEHVMDDARWSTWMKWLVETWDVRSDDWDRVWSDPFNSVVQTLQPGVMLQNGFTVPLEDVDEEKLKKESHSLADQRAGFWLTSRRMVTAPTELKVEVIFGRAYIVQVAAGTGEERDRCGYGHIITRDDTHGHVIKLYDGGFKHEETFDPTCYKWIITEGHMEQACHIAESAAKAAGIDAMRIDIFLKKGNPAAAQINENSLSSAADYQWHTPFLAKAWQEGHLAATSPVVDPGVDSHKTRAGDLHKYQPMKIRH